MNDRNFYIFTAPFNDAELRISPKFDIPGTYWKGLYGELMQVVHLFLMARQGFYSTDL